MLKPNNKGNLIVIYGVNNLGKTTQAKMLVENLIIKLNKNAEYLKYPVYQLEPSGPLINNYLKQGNAAQFSAREFQLLQVLNKTQHEAILKKKIDSGTWIVAEDYVGTGIAWGMASGVDKNLLYKLNSHLLKEDLGILLEGEPFSQATDKTNVHENNTELLSKAGQAFKEIATDFGWHIVPANQTIEEVQAQIMSIITSKISYLA